ncbi:MAG: hypothetical protein AABY22_24670 [Nanoarchaeota archaeon]
MILKIKVIPSKFGLQQFPKLKPGVWLKPTEEDLRHFKGCLSNLNIRVIQDGQKTPMLWHQDFWNVSISEIKKFI